MNPLLNIGQITPFDQIKPEHAADAIKSLIDSSRSDIEAILAKNEITWATVDALDDVHDKLDKAWSPIGHLFGVKGNDEWRAAYEASLPLISAFGAEMSQHEGLYNFYVALQKSEEYQAYNASQKKLVDDAVKDFELSGVSLPAEKKAEYQTLVQNLSQLSTTFANNETDAKEAFGVHISDEADLAGLPDSAKSLYKQLAEAKEKDGWWISLDAPSIIPIFDYAENRELREKIYHGYVTKASEIGPNAGEFDNTPVISAIMEQRQQLIELLGFDSYSAYSLSRKMADKPSDVTDFLRDLASRAKPIAEKENAELAQFAKDELVIETLEAWDRGFAAEKLREKRYAFSQEEVRDYFPMQKVVAGLFDICETLFGVKFAEKAAMPAWHDDVKTYAVIDETGNEIAAFYFDLYARQNKRGGAWVDICIDRRVTDSVKQNPVGFVTCNFIPPTGDEDAYFSHDEILTLFHEFGHALHLMLTQVPYKGQSGLNGVEWDAVELPSQFMENFCYQYDVLKGMSQHKQTGEAFPQDLFDKLIAAKNFHSALGLLRQIEFSLFDMNIHNEFDAATFDVLAAINATREEVAVVTPPEYNRFPMSFGHIFAGGYAAGYYSYKWAEVLSADAFSRFEEEGVFNADVGRDFREQILAKGSSRTAMDNFKAFRGREPKIDALLRHNGIV